MNPEKKDVGLERTADILFFRSQIHVSITRISNERVFSNMHAVLIRMILFLDSVLYYTKFKPCRELFGER